MPKKILLLLAAMLLMGSSQPADRDEYMAEMRENLQRFQKVYQHLVFRYVDRIDPEATIEAAIRGMLDELDPYTDYFIEEGARNLEEMSRGEYGGLGMQVGLRGSTKRLTIISPFEGTPAWRAGLQPGDVIAEVNGESTDGKPLSDVVKVMKGEPGTEVTISIDRPGYESNLVYTLTRELIVIQDLQYAAIMDEKQGLGYLRLTGFSGKATESMREALLELKEQGLEKLVLDLRGNPGGLLREAVGVADLLLPKGAKIVETRGRNDQVLREYYSENDPLFEGDLVVLINKGSASASEIVSGCIQDHDRGVIVGDNSYGKGLVQSVLDLDEESKVKLTTAKYYIPSGRLIQRIEYFQDNPVLQHDSTAAHADSLYHTGSGRVVVNGRGIGPDLAVEQENWPHYVSEIWRAGHLGNFLTDREREGGGLPKKVNKRLLEEFHDYLEDKDFSFKPRGSSQMDELEEIVEGENYSTEVAEALISLRQVLEGDPESHFEANREWIERLLEGEILSRRDGPGERTAYNLGHDPQYESAVHLLDSQSGDYRSMLQPSAKADGE